MYRQYRPTIIRMPSSAMSTPGSRTAKAMSPRPDLDKIKKTQGARRPAGRWYLDLIDKSVYGAFYGGMRKPTYNASVNVDLAH